MAKILIPTPLRPYAGNRDTVELPGETVGELLGALTKDYEELRRHLYTDDGRLRSFVNVYLNDENIRHLSLEGTRGQSRRHDLDRPQRGGRVRNS